jgi:DNA mismatch repair protein MutL
MDRDDLEKCLLKHATSKISQIDDLYNIKSLGFRGEALYSISAVSELIIKTKTKNTSNGYELTSRYGSKPQIVETGTSEGTFVIVKNLFGNIPARKKFLKSSSWEKTLILEYIEGIAILYPNIELIFSDNNKISLLLKSTYSVEERIFQIFPELYGKLNTSTVNLDQLNASIFISEPDLPMSPFQIFSVNKRFVKDRLFFKVLQDFYSGQRKKSPFLAMFINIPPNDVHVNVHPAKKEIKFRNAGEIYNIIRNLLEKASKKEVFFKIEEVKKEYLGSNDLLSYKSTGKETFFSKELYEQKIDEENILKIIGTFSNGYLLVEKNDVLYIIDQHAAHERLIYNKLLENYKTDSPNAQRIIPYIINTSESKKQIYENNRIFLEKLGYKFEESGPMSIAITAIPSTLSIETAIEIFINIANEKEPLKKEEDFLRVIISNSACKEAIKKTTRLSYEEIKYLLDLLSFGNMETYCPHGRNFIIPITLAELEKKFGRRS